VTIKLSAANFVHALSVIGQVLNTVSGVVPIKYQPFVAAALAGIQLLVGKLQQNTPVAPAAPSVATK
jgi:hypothetical protein